MHVNLVQYSLIQVHKLHKFVQLLANSKVMLEVRQQKDHRGQSKKAIEQQASSRIELCG